MIYELRKFKFILFLIFFLSGFFMWGNAMAACDWTGNTGTVVSPYDHADVQACVTDAAGKTGVVTINIPACEVSWDSQVNVDMSSGWTNVTSLIIQGSGATTIINDIGTNISFNVARLFQITTKSGKSVRITGMTLNANTYLGTDSNSGLIYISGDGTQIRVDNISFNLLRGSSGRDTTGVSWHQDTGAYGVIDSCIFNATGSNWGSNGIKIYGAPSGYGEATAFFGRAFTPGTANATYIENNTFTFEYRGNDCYDAYRGARIVVRYNNIHGTASGGHGNDSSGAGDSVHTQEVYNNSYDNICGGSSCNGGAKVSQAFGWRGGTGVFFNNSIDVNGYNAVSEVGNYRSNPAEEGVATNETSSRYTINVSETGLTRNDYYWIYNMTDGSYCRINSYTGTSYTCDIHSTSSDSLTIGTGSKSVAVDAGLSYVSGMEIVLTYNDSNYMIGTITSYNSTSGTLVFNVTSTNGSGTYSSWATGSGLSHGTRNTWQSGDVYMVTYYNNADLMCNGMSPVDGNISGQEGWLCKQQVGSTYDSGYVVKPIYAWGNVYNGTTEGHLTVSDGSTRQSDHHVIPNQTFFNCDSAADCKTKTDNVNIPGFGTNQGWTYTPYIYPHPLRTEATDIVAPASPTGLAVS